MSEYSQLTEVDFGQIKRNLIEYLKSTKEFTDYNFEGSNLQVILNLLSYVSQMNSYSVNMLANESFLSSSTIRDNVVLHAKSLGYTPLSATCSVAHVDVSVRLDPDQFETSEFPPFIYLEKGAAFTVRLEDDHTFNVIDKLMGAVTNEGLCTFYSLPIYDGVFVKDKFTIEYARPEKRFILNNPNIDISTIRMRVKEDSLHEFYHQYTLANNLVEAGPNDRVFWINEISDRRYEITFGDGLFGKKLPNEAIAEVEYMIAPMEKGNGIIKGYNFIGRVVDDSGNPIRAFVNVMSSETSANGSDAESLSSIKFHAPLYYGAQKRCVTETDYAALIREIYPAVSDIYVFGGETLDPPQYGRVFASIKPTFGDSLSGVTKNYIRKSLEPYRIGSLDLQLVDPVVIYVEAISSVKYDDRTTKDGEIAIISDVHKSLDMYAKSFGVSKFGGSIKFSRIVAAVDDSHPSITRNNTYLRMRRDIRGLMNRQASYEICFIQPFEQSCEGSSIWSTGFYIQIDGVESPYIHYFEDDRNGNIVLFRFDETNKKVIVDKEFGTVDYDRGEILLGYQKPIVFTRTVLKNDVIQIRGLPRDQDIIAAQQSYLTFDVSESKITAVVDRHIPNT